ncbi:hypothetical protein DPV78_010296 [Talaromyces pinophilus]|nr:hypothetical protein DPV78_010296 [Talaromyces pinophilus]
MDAQSGIGPDPLCIPDRDNASAKARPNQLGLDEAVWELDEIANSVREPSHKDNATEAAAAEETEGVKLNKREALVRDLVDLAGPPPPQLMQRLPCPVIIPQRRPRKRERGFVRAYAPVLADSGVSEDVFLEVSRVL